MLIVTSIETAAASTKPATAIARITSSRLMPDLDDGWRNGYGECMQTVDLCGIRIGRSPVSVEGLLFYPVTGRSVRRTQTMLGAVGKASRYVTLVAPPVAG